MSSTLNTLFSTLTLCCTVLRTWLNFPHFLLLHLKFSPSSWTHIRPNNNTDTGHKSAAGIPSTKSGAVIDMAVAILVPTGNAAGHGESGAMGFAVAFLNEKFTQEKEFNQSWDLEWEKTVVCRTSYSFLGCYLAILQKCSNTTTTNWCMGEEARPLHELAARVKEMESISRICVIYSCCL